VPELEVVEVHSGGDRERQGFRRRADDGFALQLDLGLDIPSRAFVRGRGLESEWRGALAVKGDASRPQVLGELRVQRGRIDFLDRTFTLAAGVVDFHGGWPPIPDLRIRAETRGRDVLGIINVTGPADDPDLKLESQPALPEDEVLARLLFDRPLDEITPAQALRLASALRGLAGGGGGLTLMDEARGALGLDTLDFEAAGADDSSVKAGKYLREDVYLEVVGGVGEGGSKARVEWDLTPSISVESSVDQESRSAFGLNWKRDY
jgi:translocation and assembly module TamB